MRIPRTLPALAAVASVGLLVTACGSSLDNNSSSSSGSGGTATLKIGFVGVTSGPAAAWGTSNVRSMQTRAELYELIQYEKYAQFDKDIYNFKP